MEDVKRVISKKVLFALSLCLVVVIGAVTAYTYLLNQKGTVDEPDFVFTWGPDEQNIVNGTFRLEIWLTLEGEKLTMIITANDDDYSWWDSIGLVFDKNQNGTIDGVKFVSAINTTVEEDEAYFLYASEYAGHVWYQGRNSFFQFYEELQPPDQTPHTVTFDPETGYTFDIRFPCHKGFFSSGNPAQWLRKGDYNPIHLYFRDSGSGGVSTEFQFYIPKES